MFYSIEELFRVNIKRFGGEFNFRSKKMVIKEIGFNIIG